MYLVDGAFTLAKKLLNYGLPLFGSFNFLLINANVCFGSHIFLVVFFAIGKNIVSKLEKCLE